MCLNKLTLTSNLPKRRKEDTIQALNISVKDETLFLGTTGILFFSLKSSDLRKVE